MDKGAVFEQIEDEETLCVRIADLIDDGNVVGLLQGRMEFGPRALGNRSLLADPRDPCMLAHLNRKVKHRERFRPLAPSVLATSRADTAPRSNPHDTSPSRGRSRSLAPQGSSTGSTRRPCPAR